MLLLVILVARLVGGWKTGVLRDSAKFMPQNMDCRLAKLGSYRLVPDNIQTLPLSNFRVTFDPGDRYFESRVQSSQDFTAESACAGLAMESLQEMASVECNLQLACVVDEPVQSAVSTSLTLAYVCSVKSQSFAIMALFAKGLCHTTSLLL